MLHVFRIVLPEQILNAIAHVYIDCLGFFRKILRSLLYFVSATKKKCVSIFCLFYISVPKISNAKFTENDCAMICLIVFLTSVKLFTEFEYLIRIKGEQGMIDHLV